MSLLYPQAAGRGFHITAPRAAGGRRTINNMAVRVRERVVGSVACLSNLVQGAEINSMLFLPPPLPTQTLGILLSLSLSLSFSRRAVVCSQHVANRVNDVDACRKSHSGGVATRIPHYDGFFSGFSSVGRPFSSNIMEAVELAPLSPRRSLSPILNVFVLSLELSVRVVRFRLHVHSVSN